MPAQFTIPSKRPGIESMNLLQSALLETSQEPVKWTTVFSVELGKLEGTLSTKSAT